MWDDTSTGEACGGGWMGLSSVLSPETGTLELEGDASEGDMEVDSEVACIGRGRLGEGFR